MKTRNVDLKAFEKSPQQMAYEQALGAWQQLSQIALEKGTKFDQPQPQPAAYGYIPGAPIDQQGTPQQASAPNPSSSPTTQNG